MKNKKKNLTCKFKGTRQFPLVKNGIVKPFPLERWEYSRENVLCITVDLPSKFKKKL